MIQSPKEQPSTTVITSTGDSILDVLTLAEVVLEGEATAREIIAKLEHIADLIEEERAQGARLVPAHIRTLETTGQYTLAELMDLRSFVQ
jgi:hypothetical protein